MLAWLDECVDVKLSVTNTPITTRSAYEQFHAWAVAEGFNRDKLPAINGFVQRVLANAQSVESKRTKTGRVFLGLSLKSSAPANSYAQPRYGR